MYLAFGFIPAPRTPFEAARKLLPGHTLAIADGEVCEREYWAYPVPNPDIPPRPDEEYAEELVARLREAIRLRLMSDVPLGAMLSGGLDRAFSSR